MNPSTERPLADCVVGISISQSPDMGRLGFAHSDLNRCVVRMSEALLAAGARIAFGHDWRPNGVMMAVAALAVRYFRVGPIWADQEINEPAPIINRVAPPDEPFLVPQSEAGKTVEPDAARDSIIRSLQGIVDARQISVPKETPRATALSFLRAELAELCHIRICVGGKIRPGEYSGVMPGIIEEALGTLRKGRPVLASAIFGGASAFLVDAVRNGPNPANEHLRAQAEEIAKRWPEASLDVDRAEQQSLWDATSIDQCVEMMLRAAIKSFRRAT